MDYRSAIYQAQENESDKQSSTWYKAELGPPKKERREKKLSVNVQKFLAKKEEEERLKQVEAERKKRELLALRSQDKKSAKRVQSMLKRTKSANKSVIEDAIDNFNTALTAAGPLQPDEDDYGYVSKDAEELYNKLITKYNNMPAEQSPFSKTSRKTAKDISNTKDRVKAALQREEDEKLLPRKRKRKSKNENDDQNDKASSDEGPDKEVDGKSEDKLETKKLHIPKKNAQMPPPMDFRTLLKIAQEKQHEPIVIKKPMEGKQERPMTMKEKQEYMRERERKMRREMGLPSLNVKNNGDANNKSDTKTSNSSRSSDEEKLKSVPISSTSAVKSETKRIAEPDRHIPANVPNNTQKIKSDSILSKNIFDVKILPSDKTKCKEIDKSPQKSSKEGYKSNDKIDIKSNSEGKPTQKNNPSLLKKANDQYYAEQQCKSISSKPGNDFEERTNLPIENLVSSRLQSSLNNNEAVTSKHSEPRRIAKSFEKVSKLSEKYNKSLEKKSIPNSHSPKVREFPPRDTVKEFLPRDVRQFPPQDVRQKPTQKPIRRKMIESDEEYDSEMDDFIDDSEDTTDISKHISEIFGYDRRKYAKYDQGGDECMESNFNDLQKEEFISTKHGILEDLAETRRKKLEKERMKKRLLAKNRY